MTTSTIRAVWLAYSLLLSGIIGISGGALAYIGGDNPARALLTGGASFAAALTITILILTFLNPRPQ